MELEHLYSRIIDPHSLPSQNAIFRKKNDKKLNHERPLTFIEAELEAHKLLSRYTDYDKIQDSIDYIEIKT